MATTPGSPNGRDDWTDDLPVCQFSGIGFHANQLYREDGGAKEDHTSGDKFFHFKEDNDIYLYGVFDGHDGSKVAHFAAQRFPAELLLGQLNNKMSEQEIKHQLYQAFISVEKGYFDAIEDFAAERANLLLELPEGMSLYVASTQFPEMFKRLEALEAEIAGGSTAVLALMINNYLYIANVGCCRALLCASSPEGKLEVTQLTVDHCLDSESELRRLANLGLNVEKLKQAGKLGNHIYTRTIGDNELKRSFRDIELLRPAKGDPVIHYPEIHNSIRLDESHLFLILMSDGLYKSLESVSNPGERVNERVAFMVINEFAQNSTLNGVAQAVVNRVARMHHDAYMTAEDPLVKERFQKRDDMTLLIRNFNYPLSLNSPSASNFFPGTINMTPPSLMIPMPATTFTSSSMGPSPCGPGPLMVMPHFNPTSTFTNTVSSRSDTVESSQSFEETLFRKPSEKAPSLDDKGRIAAYVDFDEFYAAIAALDEDQQAAFNAEVELRPSCDTIAEEKEPANSIIPQATPAIVHPQTETTVL